LKIAEADNITDIQPISDLSQLQELHLRSMKNLSDIQPLTKLSALKILTISEYKGIDLSLLANLTQIEYFYFIRFSLRVHKLAPALGGRARADMP
jgi:Leucine-rich repeat (LRR) protein